MRRVFFASSHGQRGAGALRTRSSRTIPSFPRSGFLAPAENPGAWSGVQGGVRPAPSILIFVIVVMLGAEGSVHACSCAGVPELEERVKQADAAFVGTVVEVDVPLLLRESVVPLADTPLSFVYGLEPEVRTRFRVERRYAGPLGTHVLINSGDGLCCNCSPGNIFTPGERWLVFAHERDGELRITTCRRPQLQHYDPDGFAAVLQRLGPAEASEHPNPRWTRGPRRVGRWLGRGCLALIVFVALVGWWWRRRAARSRHR